MVRRNTRMIDSIRVGPQKAAATLLSMLRGVMGRALMQYRFSSYLIVLGAVGLGLAAVAACSDDAERSCRVDADCTSGVCNSDGTCAPAVDGGSDSGTSGTPDAAHVDTNLDAGPLSNDDGGGLKGPGCAPNNDGTITRDEVPIQAGLHGVFRFAEGVEISTAGVTNSDGSRTWDYSNVLTGDANVLIETNSLDGSDGTPVPWFAGEFPSATYTTPLSKDPSLLAVFNYDAQLGSLALLGEVSTNNDAYKTDLKNDPPVEVLKFPLTMGASWTTTTNVTGTAPNPFATTKSPSIPFAYQDEYDNTVDATGSLISPLGTFNVMRVKIVLTRTFAAATEGGAPTVIVFRQFAFVTECYGNVASISSNAYEPNEEFTNAAEIRRIAP